MQTLDLKQQSNGTQIRIDTRSGNTYHLEVVDNELCMCNVSRAYPRPNAPSTGFRGTRSCQQFITVGKPFYHGNSITTPVEKIVVIN